VATAVFVFRKKDHFILTYMKKILIPLLASLPLTVLAQDINTLVQK
jgi:hypothetical protein